MWILRFCILNIQMRAKIRDMETSSPFRSTRLRYRWWKYIPWIIHEIKEKVNMICVEFIEKIGIN